MTWSDSTEPLSAREHAERASLQAQFANHEQAMAHALAAIALKLTEEEDGRENGP